MPSYFKKVKNAFHTKKLFWFLFNTLKYKKHIFFLRNPDIKRCAIEDQVYYKIKNKYRKIFTRQEYNLPMKKSNTIWTCWLKGLDNATDLSYVCINRLVELFGERVIVISLENYSDYIKLPEYIVDKFKKGYISYQHFADIIRNFLLVDYGGTWIDATVYIDNINSIPNYVFNSDLFMFHHGGRNTKLEFLNYFITSTSNNPVLITTKNFLLELYKRQNHEIDYLQMCIALGIACEVYYEYYAKMQKFSDIQVHMLANEMNNPFNKEKYDNIINMCPIQKLSNKKLYVEDPDTFYDYLIRKKVCR